MQRKYEEEKNQLDSEHFLSINAFKEQLDEDREKLQEKLVGENNKKIAINISDKQETFFSELKALANRKEHIINKHRLNRTAIEKEYQVRFKLLPDVKISESDKLKAELRVEEEIRNLKVTNAEEYSLLSNTLKNDQVELKRTLERDFESKKQEYMKEADKQISNKQSLEQSSTEDVRKLSKELVALTSNIRTIKGEIRELQATIKHKTKELDNLNNNTKHLKTKTEKESMKIHKTEQYNTDHEVITTLQEQIERQDKQILVLKNELKEEPQNEVKAFIELQAINNKLDDIKRCLSQESAQRVPRQHYSQYITIPKKTPSKIPRKVQEVAMFVDSEKTRLLLAKQSILKDYKVSVKLLKGLQGNVIEWNTEVSQADHVNPIIGGLKNNLDKQIEVLNKQIGKIRYLE
jgi:chromosome segregation ATPase